MKSIQWAACISIIMMASCQQKEKQNPETALETGRMFIQSSLQGNFKEAATLLLDEPQNQQLFQAYQQYYRRMPEERKQHYKTASYEINKYADLNDSVTIINYSNDYMHKPMEIKVVKKNNRWWVDFEYTYSGNLPID